MTTTVIDMLRHGEPEGGRRYRGQIDDPLSDKGWRQMRAATAGARPWQAIVSSPMARCRAFAEELAGQTGLPLAFDARLKEVGFGSWEGRTADEIKAADPAAVFNFKCDPVAFRPDGAEPLDAFYARVGAAWEDILSRHAGSHVLVVCHAGVMRMAICRALGLATGHAYRLQIGSAALARLRVEQRGELRHAALLHLTPGQ
ncbi:histidine phosphatase family protein [Parasulfuritortus cantonensis]|uniref:Histidine phosphatase family protein n=1 Tax=Parasulfuritortus cantonensis TaxID=2528202 RepID=A0A4R1B0M8_9PROT|nr:alpha-ribazole phosphatase family protein [Parasulfuritortus cantonensis]TCJ11504.1 histidine phosphatase family protein [Parasulfuritortus cantonensis]